MVKGAQVEFSASAGQPLDYSGPAQVPNWIAGAESPALSGTWFEKVNPDTGRPLCHAARSGAADVDRAVLSARKTQSAWGAIAAVRRGEILLDVALALRARRTEVARVVASETGKSVKAALDETDGAASLGLFMAGEGQRLYGRTTTSRVPYRQVMTIRQPLGVAGLIVPANTPIANIAWKVFPALVCGNSAVLKSAEDAPATAWLFGRIAHDAHLPPGVLNIVHGDGVEAGLPLAAHPDVEVISFTGSTAAGRRIAMTAGQRLAKVSLELGGKNPFVVCDDADLPSAVRWALLSAFSNAGQRCAAGSRIIVFDAVYDEFVDLLTRQARCLKIGASDDDDFGPLINERQLRRVLSAIERARAEGARILTGGARLDGDAHRGGFYLAPTLIEPLTPHDEISRTELFGPVACLYRVRDFNDAIERANDSPYGLTACIHTRNVNRAMQFVQQMQSGVAVVNAGTYGSEPHLPFGGVKQSGNGTREPGTEALDVYSSLKSVCIATDPLVV